MSAGVPTGAVLAPRPCRRCGVPIRLRQVRFGDGSVLWLYDQHDAPCGLPCRERSRYAEVHSGPGRCVRCPAQPRSTRRRRPGARRARR